MKEVDAEEYVRWMERLECKMSKLKKLADTRPDGKRLNMSEAVVLMRLAKDGVLTMGKLARNGFMNLSTTTVVVDELVKTGLIERNRSSSDRRIVTARLTPKGRQFTKKIERRRREMLKRAFNVISERDVRHVLEAYERIIDALGNQGIAGRLSL